MVGLVVTPTTASSFINLASSPDSSMVRERESIQTDCSRLLSLWRFESAITHLPFHGSDLSQPPYVTIAAVESCPDQGAHQLGGEARPDHPRAQAEHVHVVVLDALVRRVGVVARRGANPADLCGCERGADAGAADENAALRRAARDRLTELACLVRVVDPHGVGVGAEIDGLVTVAAQELEHGLAQVHPPVVEGDGDPHGCTRFLVSDTKRCPGRTYRSAAESPTSRSFVPAGHGLVSDTGTGRIRTRASATRVPVPSRCRPCSRTSRARARLARTRRSARSRCC